MIWDICKAFNCTPAEALRQDPLVVFPVMECAAAEQARDMVSSNPNAITGDMRKLLVELKEMRDAVGAEP